MGSNQQLDIVTGAFSYTGSAIAGRLLANGRRVRTLTFHPDRSSPLQGRIEVAPYRFDDRAALADDLRGATTLYNTYWVRFDRAGVTFERAIENSRLLFEAARAAGVARVVHVSVTKPSADSVYPYFRGKAVVEDLLRGIAPSYAVVRPSVVFGPNDILMNNIAWLLRRFPVFGVPGSGTYRVRPVHVDDVARICVEAGASGANDTIDAVGPETLTFEEMVGMIRDAVGSRSRLIHAPAALARGLARLIGVVARDVLVTDHELGGLMAELACTDGPATGSTRFSEWIRQAGPTLGLRYASEIDRHYERR